MKEFRGYIVYTDRRTGESWGDNEHCHANDYDGAKQEFQRRISNSNGQAELVSIELAK